MINCIAIDDEPLALAQLESYIARVPFLNLVGSCRDAFEGMRILASEKIDLLFVDINMPDFNGLEFVRSLQECPLVVFTTAYSEYAVDGFKVDAVDYLLKPFGFQDFLMAVNKVRKRMEHRVSVVADVNHDDESLFVKSDYKVMRVRFRDIKYVESMGEYVRIFIEGEDRPVMSLLSIKRLEELLPVSLFMRVHRSYIVNLRKITEISKLRILFGEVHIPVGDVYKERFLEYVNERMAK